MNFKKKLNCVIPFTRIFSILKIYVVGLRGRVIEQEEETKTKREQVSWDKTKSRNQEILPVLPHGCRDPSTWAKCCCIPRCVTRKRQEMYQPRKEPVLRWNAGTTGSGPTHYATVHTPRMFETV